jgi:tetratricopeptide (TPR) repeat protein
MSTEQDLKRALAHHQAGNVKEAAEMYRDILKRDPKSVDAWNLLSTIFVDSGNFAAAIAAAGQAAQLQPDYFAPYLNIGNAYQGAGKLAEAIAAFEKAIELAPESPESHNNLASALNAAGRYDEALVSCKVALAYRPDFLEAFNNRGNAEAGLGLLPQAVASYRHVLARQPDNSDALYNLGGALIQQGDMDEAVNCYRLAVRLDPESPEKQFNLGNALLAAGDLDGAEGAFRMAIARRPEYGDAINNLGSVLQAQGRLDEAEAAFRQALVADPNGADIHWNLAVLYLQKGDYAQGWREYEWRWRNPEFAAHVRSFKEPFWDGEALAGKTILLHAEQGFGDSIQFARYAPLVAKRGGKVIVECPGPLTSLLATLDGVDGVLRRGDALPAVDVQSPLMSLPRIFGTTLDTVPAEIPYLSVPKGKTADGRLTNASGLKVGFVCSGSRTRRDNRTRSFDPAQMAMLLDVQGVTFFSLQTDAPDAALDPAIVDLGPTLKDFGDTAAAVEALDLVISVDTALAHLAGAMGKPVWALLSFAPGFLWMLEREDTPWYPTARLFRQPEWGDWQTVFYDVKAALRDLVRERKP